MVEGLADDVIAVLVEGETLSMLEIEAVSVVSGEDCNNQNLRLLLFSFQ